MTLIHHFRQTAVLALVVLALASCGGEAEAPRAKWIETAAAQPNGGDGAETHQSMSGSASVSNCDEVLFMARSWAQLGQQFARALDAGLTAKSADRYARAIGQELAESRPVVARLTQSVEPELADLGRRLDGHLDAVTVAETAETAFEGIVDLLDTLDVAFDRCGWDSAAPGTGIGIIAVTYEETSTYDDLARSLAGSGIFEGMAESVHSVVALPTDLQVVFTECGKPDAYYNGTVVMCYEFVDLLVDIFLEYFEDPVVLQEAVFGSTAFFYLHEIGHALVHQLQIPITGREEDSVDSLATLILLLGGSTDALLAATQNFATLSAAWESHGELPFWDEHSMLGQRQYDIACMIYGSDPETWGHLVGPELLPEERAVRCPAEFAQKSLAWDRLLAPYYRP